jgi:hypothetical protein
MPMSSGVPSQKGAGGVCGGVGVPRRQDTRGT